MATKKVSKSAIKRNREIADAMAMDSNMGMNPAYQRAKKKSTKKK